jgi:hypothetical protein
MPSTDAVRVFSTPKSEEVVRTGPQRPLGLCVRVATDFREGLTRRRAVSARMREIAFHCLTKLRIDLVCDRHHSD